MNTPKDSESGWVECVVLEPSMLPTLSNPENQPTEGIKNILKQFGQCEKSMTLTFPESYPYRTSGVLN